MNNRLEEIRARCEAATPGKWRVVDTSRGIEVHDSHTWGKALSPFGRIERDEWENADFIAHARQDIPWLLEQIAEKDAEAARLKDALSAKDAINEMYRITPTEIENQRNVAIDRMNALACKLNESNKRVASLQSKLAEAVKVINEYAECIECKHVKNDGVICETNDYNCGECGAIDCICKMCRGNRHFEWKGLED